MLVLMASSILAQILHETHKLEGVKGMQKYKYVKG